MGVIVPPRDPRQRPVDDPPDGPIRDPKEPPSRDPADVPVRDPEPPPDSEPVREPIDPAPGGDQPPKPD
jgi:hypothetical protein